MRTLLVIASTALLAGACSRTPASEGPGPFTLNELDTRPEFINCYGYTPPASSHTGETASRRVRVKFDLSPSGRAVNPEVTETSPHASGSVRAIAREIASTCEYTPGIKDGRAVPVTGLTRLFSIAVR